MFFKNKYLIQLAVVLMTSICHAQSYEVNKIALPNNKGLSIVDAVSREGAALVGRTTEEVSFLIRNGIVTTLPSSFKGLRILSVSPNGNILVADNRINSSDCILFIYSSTGISKEIARNNSPYCSYETGLVNNQGRAAFSLFFSGSFTPLYYYNGDSISTIFSDLDSSFQTANIAFLTDAGEVIGTYNRLVSGSPTSSIFKYNSESGRQVLATPAIPNILTSISTGYFTSFATSEGDLPIITSDNSGSKYYIWSPITGVVKTTTPELLLPYLSNELISDLIARSQIASIECSLARSQNMYSVRAYAVSKQGAVVVEHYNKSKQVELALLVPNGNPHQDYCLKEKDLVVNLYGTCRQFISAKIANYISLKPEAAGKSCIAVIKLKHNGKPLTNATIKREGKLDNKINVREKQKTNRKGIATFTFKVKALRITRFLAISRDKNLREAEFNLFE